MAVPIRSISVLDLWLNVDFEMRQPAISPMNAFALFNLSWKNHVKVNANLFRPSDINQSSANPSKAKRILDREAKVDLESVIERMCETAVAIEMKYKN